MRPGDTDDIGELEQLTGVLTQQRDGMEHGESRRFAEILLQGAMAKVCEQKAGGTMPEHDLREDPHDATEAQERIEQALVGRMTPIDPGAGAGGTIVAEAAGVQAPDRERAGTDGGVPSPDPAASPVAASAAVASPPRRGGARA